MNLKASVKKIKLKLRLTLSKVVDINIYGIIVSRVKKVRILSQGINKTRGIENSLRIGDKSRHYVYRRSFPFSKTPRVALNIDRLFLERLSRFSIMKNLGRHSSLLT